MSFTRPLLADLITRIKSDVQSRFPGTEPDLQNSLTGIIARMEAGATHELYGTLSWLAANLLPDTKDPDILSRWATIYDIPRQQPKAAIGDVTFTGTANTVVPVATLVQSSTGEQYSLDADVTLTGGSGTGSVTAMTAGKTGNQIVGTSLSLVSPVAGVDSSATVAAGGLAGGTDLEIVDAWSARLLQRIQQPPQGGSLSDYERWALEASGEITNAWVSAHEGGQIGVVTVRIATYGDQAGDLPPNNSPLFDIVEDYINARRPVAGELQVFAPLAQPVNMTLAIKPDSTALRNAAEAAMADLFRREAQPGKFIPGQGQLAGAIPRTHVDEALSLVDGETDHQVQNIDSLTPAAAGKMLTLGVITWSGWQS